MKHHFLEGFLFLFFCCRLNAQAPVIVAPLPTPSQLLWQQSELGVLISYDLHVFDSSKYNQAENRISPIADINIFNPNQLSTDQWIRSAKAGGAKFAVLTVTHETGFALYQSDVNPYCMKALKFQNGKGDIVRDFVNSCRKYGILPGIYLGIRWNSFLGVHDFRIEGESPFVKNRQLAYKKMCEGMVRELCTRYGDLFMIWFDGGADDPTKFGADVLPIVQQTQPNCLFYHNAQRADFRWGGSESGTVPYPCWSTFAFPFSHAAKKDLVFANDFKLLKNGDANGKYWMPAMSDAPLRGYAGRHEWFWEPGDEKNVFPLNDLVKMYEQSVGHNSTLIIGLTPDDKGLIPAVDEKRLEEWGKAISEKYANPIKSVKGEGALVEIKLPEKRTIQRFVLQEDIAKGERVRSFIIEGKINGGWKKITEGTCIGHKYIVECTPVITNQLRLKIVESTNKPLIKTFALY